MAPHQTSGLNSERAQRRALLHGIYVIVNEGEDDPVSVARAALAGGVRIIQYRAKHGIDAGNLRAIREATINHDALLIVNDDWRAAVIFDCDGVHLGPDDQGFANVTPIRAALGLRLIGLSCGTVEEATSTAAMDIDYLGVGAVYATSSKADAGDPIGISGLRAVAAAARVPVAAIGGVNAANISDVRASGVAMAAVISAVGAAPSPEAAAATLVARWNEPYA